MTAELADAFRRRAGHARQAAATTAGSQVDVEIERARAEAWSEAARLTDIAAGGPPQDPARPAPPAGSLIRTAGTGTVWHLRADGGCEAARPPHGLVYLCHPWPDLAAGFDGTVELLVPIPYTGAADTPAGQYLAEAVLDPAAAMMMQLAQAAGAGVTAVVAEVYRRGMAEGTSGG